MTTTTLIDRIELESNYGTTVTVAVIDDPKHGRLLIRNAFGGMDRLEGGAVRWNQGSAIRLKPEDTIKSLQDTPWNAAYNTFEAVMDLSDPERPYLHWSGYAVEAIAKKIGLS